ncbi:hypothetical protein ACFY4I_10815 [Streptomyces scabiei]
MTVRKLAAALFGAAAIVTSTLGLDGKNAVVPDEARASALAAHRAVLRIR